MTESNNDAKPIAVVRRLVLSSLTNPAHVTGLSAGELDLLLRLLRRVRLLGWLAVQLEEAGAIRALPGPAAEQLSSALAVAEARARLAGWELDRISWALREGPEIQVIAMKGCAYLLRQLPIATGRIFADVDLLVAERDLDAVEDALIRHGWEAAELSPYDQNFYRAWSHELPAMVHVEREVEIDVHHNIRGRFAPFKPDAALLLRDARPIAGSEFQSLSDVDVVLHAMTHLMFGGDQADGLRDLVDIDALSRQFMAADGSFWQRLADRAAELDLGLPAFYSVRYARALLDTPVPDEVVAALDAFAPAGGIVRFMDWAVPLALLPQHPDAPSRRVAFARWLLYIRSHWVSMPPLMLLRHLSYKFYVRHLQGRLPGRGGNEGSR